MGELFSRKSEVPMIKGFRFERSEFPPAVSYLPPVAPTSSVQTCMDRAGSAELGSTYSIHGVTPQLSLPPRRRKLNVDCKRELKGRTNTNQRIASRGRSRIADSAGSRPPSPPIARVKSMPVARMVLSTTILKITLLLEPWPPLTMLDAV
jgi:hypothetical protein